MSLPPPHPTPPGATPPGWYDDPWNPALRRYWDGATWTGYTDDLYGTHAGGEDPAPLVRRNAAVTRWLRTLVLVAPVVQALSLGVTGAGMHQLFDDFDTLSRNGSASISTSNGWLGLGQLLSLVGIAVLVVRMVWIYRAARTARALGWYQQREPGLVCAGWLIPVVNLWWPYQGMRDLFPDGHAARSRVGWWWACYLVSSFGGAAAVFASLFVGAGALVALLAVPALIGLVGGVLEAGLVAEAQHVHALHSGVGPAR